jgi:hypothetical protein
LFLYIVRILHVLLCSELDFTCTVHKGIEHSVANIYLALEQHTFCGTVWLLQTLRNRNSRNHFAQSEMPEDSPAVCLLYDAGMMSL